MIQAALWNRNIGQCCQRKGRAVLRRILFWAFVSLIVVSILVVSFADTIGESSLAEEAQQELEDNIDQNLDDLDLSQLDEWLAQTDGQSGIWISQGFRKAIEDVIAGKFEGGFSSFASLLLQDIGGGLRGAIPTFISMIAIAILYGVLQGMTSGFLSQQTKEMVYFACYAAVLVLLFLHVARFVAMTVRTVQSMQNLMEISFPVLVTAITVLGGVQTGAVFQPMMSVLSTSISTLVVKLILPMFVAMLIFCVVSNLTSHVKLDRLTRFFHSAAKTILGGVFGVFVTFLTLQGLTGNIADSISVKTAKFALQSYIPILGGYLSEGFDLVMASVVLIKNAFGLIVVFALLGTILLPIMQIVIFSLGLKFVSGIVEPIADTRMSKILFDTGKNLNLLAAAIAAVGFLFLITVMLVIAACNFGMGV